MASPEKMCAFSRMLEVVYEIEKVVLPKWGFTSKEFEFTQSHHEDSGLTETITISFSGKMIDGL